MLENKNIAILIISLAGGGGEREAAILANQFSQSNKVYLVMLSDTIDYDIDPEVNIHYLEKSPVHSKSIMRILKLPKLAIKYKQFCQNEKIDISLSVLTRTNLIAGIAKRRGNRPQTNMLEVISLNSAYPKKGNMSAKIMRYLIKKIYRYADLIIPNSRGSEKELNEDFGFHHTHTIYNPLEIEKILKLGEAQPKIMPSKDKFSFVMVARFQSQKDFRTLLQAFSRMKSQNKELILVGDGEEKEEMMQLAKDLKIDQDVVFAGFDRNPFSYLSRCDCFVFSTFFEGFPNSMQEAMAFGLPIISSDCHNGPREMIDPKLKVDQEIFFEKKLYEGQCGYLVPVADADALAEAMDTMMSSPEKARAFGLNAKSISENFEVVKIVEEFSKQLSR